MAKYPFPFSVLETLTRSLASLRSWEEQAETREKFRKVIDDFNFRDLGYHGIPLTWCKRREDMKSKWLSN